MLALLYLPGLSFTAGAQERLVKGRVTSGQDNAPLSFVTVQVKGTQQGASTDEQGRYQLRASTGQTLIFSFMGFDSKEIVLAEQVEVNVSLEPKVNNLNDVVVVGYGSQSRATLTTSISKLDTAVLKNKPYANVATALQGAVSGVRVQTTTGQPGAAPRVIVRGGTSINNPNGASPLYIVDGVIRADLNDISADNIASMQVLKDAAATSIYGARGANGVVILTTKTGAMGKADISYRYNIGFSDFNRRFDFASAQDFIYFNRLGIAATGQVNPTQLSRLTMATGSGTGNNLTNRTGFTVMYLTPDNEHKLQQGWKSMPDPLDPSKTIIYQETDWQDVLFRTGITQQHYLSYAAGTEKVRLFGGVGYLTDQGVAIGTGYKRFNADLNADANIRDNVKVFSRVNFSNSQDNEVYNINNIFERSIGLPSTAKMYYEDGTLAPGQNRSLGNPLYHLDKYKTGNNLNRLSLSVGGEWAIIPELKFEPSASLYMVQGITNAFQLAYYNTPTQFVDTRDASAGHTLYLQKQFDGVLTYSKSFSAHNFQAKGGISYFNRVNYGLSASGRGASTDLIPTLNAAAEPVSVSSNTSRQIIAGYFGRLTYDYSGKYLLEVNARYDGASNLGNNYKWGLFPGISAGWNVHKEQFWTAGRTLSTLKLRASYGVNGNISGLSDFHAQGQYSVGARYNGLAAIQNQRLANQDLQWERSATFDVGLDAGLFNNRISIVADYYRRVTDNLLTNLDLPHYTGFASILTNLGSLENKGFEIEVNADLLRPESEVKVNVGLVSSFVKNKILKLPPNGNEFNRVGGIYIYDPKRNSYVWAGGLQEGQPIGDVFAYKQLSIYATDAEAKAGPVDMVVPLANKTKYGGDVNWMDIDRNDTIDTRDRAYVGNIYPKWTGGFNTTVTYRNFTLTARTDFAIGHTIYNYTRAQFIGQFQGDINILSDVKNSWQKQGDVTDIPRYYWADQTVRSNIFRGNSRYYEKGDYLALREVTLSYKLPASLISRVGMTNARVYATGSNLHYFTAYKGLLPEEGGEERGRYPVPRSFILGVNVNF